MFRSVGGSWSCDLHNSLAIKADEGFASSTCAFQNDSGHHYSSQGEGKNLR